MRIRMLETIPSEVKDHIFSYLPQDSLYCLLLTSPALYDEAASHLYRSPKLRTTYRFAQFVTTVSHSSRYAGMVRSFELSDSTEAEDRTNDFASWREWIYREIPLYAARPPPKQLIDPKTEIYEGTHPSTNDLLYRASVFMPVGFVVHVLAACQSIRQVKLNFRALTNDDLIKFPQYPPSTISGMLFSSEFARSWTQGSADVESVQPNFLIRYLSGLLKLERIQIQNAPWLTGGDVQDILWNCPRLNQVDFRHSGSFMREHGLVVSEETTKWVIPWAMKGSKRDCAATLPATMVSDCLSRGSRASERETH